MRLHYLPPSKHRWKIRSETFQGIADAMASQWGIAYDTHPISTITWITPTQSGYLPCMVGIY